MTPVDDLAPIADRCTGHRPPAAWRSCTGGPALAVVAMTRRRCRLAVAVLILGMTVLYWPPQRVDVSPLFEQTGRPDRPSHPRSIYTPPGR